MTLWHCLDKCVDFGTGPEDRSCGTSVTLCLGEEGNWIDARDV